MERLSKEFLEELATNKQLTTHQIQSSVEQELKQLSEEIATRAR